MKSKNLDARQKVAKHIKENLMDVVDDGKIAGEELMNLDNSMAEIANLVLDSMGFQVENVSEDGTISATINLQDLD